MVTLNYKRQFLLAAICCAMVTAARSQFVSGDYKRSADDYYAKGDFHSAAQYYEKYLTGKQKNNAAYDPYQIQKQGAVKAQKSSNAETLYHLAESYRKLTDYQHAATWYKTLLDKDAASYPAARYAYATCLRANGDYAGAQQQLESFLQQPGISDSDRALAKQELANCVFIREQLAKTNTGITVTRLDDNINTEGASYAAARAGTGTLVFTSTRATSSSADHTNHLYSISWPANTTAPALLNIPALSKQQEGVASFSPDGTRAYLTIWNVLNGRKYAAIYTSQKKDTSWSTPVALGSTINIAGYNAQQPQVTADGQYLLFTSDCPGGQGQTDIWFAPLDAHGKPGTAINAGPSINTKEAEEAPFYHTATHTLVFASNGRTGLGGFDLYSAEGDFKGSWQEPVNLGYPINSIKNDNYFVSYGSGLLDQALISTDRASLCCMELFSISKPAPQPVPEPVQQTPPVEEKTVTTTPDEDIKAIPGGDKVLFAFDAATLTGDANKYLDQVAAHLKAHPELKVEIGAYTDSKGTAEYNQRLSDKRAAKCVAYLVKAGIEASRLTPKGYGSCCPIEKETTDAGKDDEAARQKNRRVVIKVME